jgi:hypothetical protein
MWVNCVAAIAAIAENTMLLGESSYAIAGLAQWIASALLRKKSITIPPASSIDTPATALS